MENGMKELSLEEMKTVNGGWTLIGGAAAGTAGVRIHTPVPKKD